MNDLEELMNLIIPPSLDSSLCGASSIGMYRSVMFKPVQSSYRVPRKAAWWDRHFGCCWHCSSNTSKPYALPFANETVLPVQKFDGWLNVCGTISKVAPRHWTDAQSAWTRLLAQQLYIEYCAAKCRCAFGVKWLPKGQACQLSKWIQIRLVSSGSVRFLLISYPTNPQVYNLRAKSAKYPLECR
jgi:hypothetical protein